MKKELKLAIIGTGWPGQQHAMALAAIPNVQLRSCADTNSERLRVFVETYKPENFFEDYQELLRDRDLDAAIICLPNFLHFPASLATLEAGKHVLCEKPPTMNAAEMKVLRDEAARRAGPVRHRVCRPHRPDRRERRQDRQQAVPQWRTGGEDSNYAGG